LGATRLPDGSWEFLLWAPHARSVSVSFQNGSLPRLPMESLPNGYHHAIAEDLPSASRYFYRIDDERELPDPASRFQPEGVHGPSQLIDTRSFRWSDQDWKGVALRSSIFYELHVGTYTSAGTFDALIEHLPALRDLGVTTVELMPIAQFPGPRNWGYDGVYPFAPQNSYGGPDSLHRLVDAAHGHGLAVALDVVYNHLGPEGNYLSVFGPYFTDRYRTPWGEAVNFDSSGSDEVRRFFIENALYWLEDYHFDALRLDAIHGIFDFSARHVLAELKSAVAHLSTRVGRQLHLIAESDLNDSRILRGSDKGGYGLDAQWSDDFHHAVHTLLTQEKLGYFADFGGIEPLASTLRDGWYYRGQHSEYRNRKHGDSPRGVSAEHFVVCNQNHDQVGNRALGERLAALVDFESQKLAAGITLLSPFVPLLFMGEEYGETAPFQYFTSHGDPELVAAVSRGRREEFASFGWQESVPDPQDEATFTRSRLHHDQKNHEPHRTLFRLYQHLIAIRQKYQLGVPAQWTVREIGNCAVLLLRNSGGNGLATIFNFAEFPVVAELPELSGEWKVLIHSAAKTWMGTAEDSVSFRDLAASSQLRILPRSFLMIEQQTEKEIE